MAQLKDLTGAISFVLLAAAAGEVEDANVLLNGLITNPATAKLIPTLVIAMDEVAKQYDSGTSDLSEPDKVSANLDSLT